jgi:hypothetical protein
VLDLAATRAVLRRRTSWRTGPVLEIVLLLLAPVLAWLVLRVRLMSPVVLPDPAIHTSYIVDPHDFYLRYAHVLAATGRLREGARVGFLVPARISYLLFGAVPGFFVYRYLLALVAIGPAYLFFRRVYGVWAGAVVVAVVLTSPVLVVAWGTDYPDSATVSYLLGGLACLGLTWVGRRRLWLSAATALFSLAIWAHAVAIPLVAVAAVVYLVLRLVRDRPGLLLDAALAVGVFAVVTGLLAVGSGLLLGPYDYIRTTWQSLRVLSQPAQVATWHSSNWRWAPYVSYLLVPPAVVLAAALGAGRRLPRLAAPQLMVLLVAAGQLVAFVWLQFFGNVQTLEMHYFSSTLWGSVCLALALALVEIGRPLGSRRRLAWVPAALLVVVPLLYETNPHVPAFSWLPWGAVVAGLLVVAAAVGGWASAEGRWLPPATAVLASVGVTACALILTVAPVPAHRHLPGTAVDPPAAYAGALGGSSAALIDSYRVVAEVPGFVGHPAYPGEQLLTWWSQPQTFDLIGPIGIFHSGYDALPPSLPYVGPDVAGVLAARRPGQLLFLGETPAPFRLALSGLAPWHPTVQRKGVLRSGPVAVYLWLVRLGIYAHPGGG